MAIDVDNSTFPVGQTTYSHLELEQPVIISPPFTFFSWFKPNGFAGSNGAVLINVQGRFFPGNDRSYGLFLSPAISATPNRVALNRDGIGGFPKISYSDSEYVLDQWQSAAGVCSSYFNGVTYLNGVAGTPNTEESLDITFWLTTTLIGTALTNIPTFVAPYNGCTAYNYVWGVALDPEEILAMHNGTPPLEIRPDDLLTGLNRSTLETNEINTVGPDFTIFDPLDRFSLCNTNPPIITPITARPRTSVWWRD